MTSELIEHERVGGVQPGPGLEWWRHRDAGSQAPVTGRYPHRLRATQAEADQGNPAAIQTRIKGDHVAHAIEQVIMLTGWGAKLDRVARAGLIEGDDGQATLHKG